MFAEPVPVRRPGVCVMGVEARDTAGDSGEDSGIGMTKTGLYLAAEELVDEFKYSTEHDALDCKPHHLYPGCPVRNDDITCPWLPCLWKFPSSPIILAVCKVSCKWVQ